MKKSSAKKSTAPAKKTAVQTRKRTASKQEQVYTPPPVPVYMPTTAPMSVQPSPVTAPSGQYQPVAPVQTPSVAGNPSSGYQTPQATTPHVQSGVKRRPRKNIFLYVVVPIVIGVVAIGGYFLITTVFADASGSEAKRNAQVIKRLAEVVKFPEGTPRIIAIENVEELRKTSGAFFQDASDGDLLILFSLPGGYTKIYLYGVEEERLIQMTTTAGNL